MHGGMSNSLHLDNHQDWQLLDGRTLFNRLQIKIQRKFDTCDLQDRIINVSKPDSSRLHNYSLLNLNFDKKVLFCINVLSRAT